MSADVDLIAKNDPEKTESLKREKDIVFTRALAARGMVEKAQLLALLAKTPVDAESRERIRGFIESDFK
jgi:hypothetical protein